MNSKKINEGTHFVQPPYTEPRRVGCTLNGESAKMLDIVLAKQHRSFTDWLKRSIELDYRDLGRQGTY